MDGRSFEFSSRYLQLLAKVASANHCTPFGLSQAEGHQGVHPLLLEGVKKVAASALVIGLPHDCSYLNLLSPPDSTVMTIFLFFTRVPRHQTNLIMTGSLFSYKLEHFSEKNIWEELELILKASTLTTKLCLQGQQSNG